VVVEYIKKGRNHLQSEEARHGIDEREKTDRDLKAKVNDWPSPANLIQKEEWDELISKKEIVLH
jgi:hypothetical protein